MELDKIEEEKVSVEQMEDEIPTRDTDSLFEIKLRKAKTLGELIGAESKRRSSFQNKYLDEIEKEGISPLGSK